MTVATAFGGGPAVERDAVYGVGADVSGSIAAAHPGGHHGSTPLAVPPIAETEISGEDADPNDASSHSWHPASVALQSAGWADAVSPRRISDPSVLIANAADLSRLCRLLL